MYNNNYKPILLLILLAHFVLIFVLSASSISLPTDMIENLIWGKTLDFASDKHPPFFGWESYLTFKLFGGNLLFYHILTPLHQVFLLLFVYLLADRILKSPYKALVAVILAQGIIFHTFYYRFNANTANYGFFTAIYYYFYLALKEQKYKFFIIVGALSGITVLIKYSAIIMIGSLGLILLITKEGRRAFKSPFLYLGLVAFCLVLYKYVNHAFLSDYSKDGGLQYFAEQSLNAEMRWFEIPRMIITPIIASIPALIVFFQIKTYFIRRAKNFDKTFLLITSLSPFIGTLLFAIFTKSQVGFYWLCMFYSLFPILALYFWEIKQNKIKMIAKIMYSILFVIYAVYFGGNVINQKEDTKAIGSFVKEITKDEINYVICNDTRRICGTVALYGMDFENVIMPISRWKNPFDEVNNSNNKPSKILVIGTDEKLNLPDYKTEIITKSFPKYYTFNALSNLVKKVDSENTTPTEITFTIATLKNKDDNPKKP